MTNEIFLRHKADNPQIVFTLTESKFITIEKTWCEEYGTYNIFKRDFYTKSNMKKCYVDTFIKEIKVERNKLCTCKNGYEFRIKNSCLEEFLNEALS